MAEHPLTLFVSPTQSRTPSATEAELVKAVQFAAQDTAQALELTEALLELSPPAPENAPMIAKMVAGRLFNAAMLVMGSVKSQEAVRHER